MWKISVKFDTGAAFLIDDTGSELRNVFLFLKE